MFYNDIIKKSDIEVRIKDIALKILDNQRISFDEGVLLFKDAPLGLLGMLAFEIKKRKSGMKVFYNIKE